MDIGPAYSFDAVELREQAARLLAVAAQAAELAAELYLQAAGILDIMELSNQPRKSQ